LDKLQEWSELQGRMRAFAQAHEELCASSLLTKFGSAFHKSSCVVQAKYIAVSAEFTKFQPLSLFNGLNRGTTYVSEDQSLDFVLSGIASNLVDRRMAADPATKQYWSLPAGGFCEHQICFFGPSWEDKEFGRPDDPFAGSMH
jgi:hypothetical protein